MCRAGGAHKNLSTDKVIARWWWKQPGLFWLLKFEFSRPKKVFFNQLQILFVSLKVCYRRIEIKSRTVQGVSFKSLWFAIFVLKFIVWNFLFQSINKSKFTTWYLYSWFLKWQKNWNTQIWLKSYFSQQLTSIHSIFRHICTFGEQWWTVHSRP